MDMSGTGEVLQIFPCPDKVEDKVEGLKILDATGRVIGKVISIR